MIEYSECKWCGERINRADGIGYWMHMDDGVIRNWCKTTMATPPDNYGRCTECNAENWRTCGCTHIVALINEEKQSGR